MRSRVFHNWNFLRIFRLLLGVAVIIQGMRTHERVFLAAGILLAVMAIFDLGCNGTAGCSVAPAKTNENKENKVKEISYEEVD